ncbi:MAG: metal ABC transporter substrate-binding protein [Planctomycetota bacterium]
MTQTHSIQRSFRCALACALAAACALSVGCSRQDPTEAAQPPASATRVTREVATTIYPLQYMAERIAGDAVPVRAAADDGSGIVDPETVAQLQQSQLVVINGLNVETWLRSASLPRSRLVRTTRGLPNLIVTGSVTHSHGTEGEHSHDVYNGHVWLDPIYARMQAERISDAMNEAFPEHAAAFAANYDGLAADFDTIHERLSNLDMSRLRVTTDHPAHDYLARRYGWPTEPSDAPEIIISTAEGNGVWLPAMQTGPASEDFISDLDTAIAQLEQAILAARAQLSGAE